MTKIEKIGSLFVRNEWYYKWKLEKYILRKEGFRRNWKLAKYCQKNAASIHPGSKFKKKIYLGHAGHGIHITNYSFLGNTVIMQNTTIGNKGSAQTRKMGNSKGFLFIGTNSFVSDEITIGKNVIIAANSVVTKNVPDNTIVVGVNKFSKINMEMLKNMKMEYFNE